MNYIRIQGIRPYDGRYELDLDGQPFTTREWGWIKRYSGYLPLTFDEGWRGGDPELFTCFAVIALRRAGTLELGDIQACVERLLDESFDMTKITIEADPGEQAETVVLPPPANSPSNTPTSGTDSGTSSENQADGRKPTGIPDSATSELHPTRWAS